jgi:polyhydroxyalkanoate synthesis regulator phasin
MSQQPTVTVMPPTSRRARRPWPRPPVRRPPSASVAGSGAQPVLMAEPASERSPLETLGLVGIGAVALVAERADELAAEIGARLGVERDDVRSAIADVLDSWRREAARLGETGGSMAARAASELGTASREAVDDLALRVAQLEHRVRLLERE